MKGKPLLNSFCNLQFVKWIIQVFRNLKWIHIFLSNPNFLLKVLGAVKSKPWINITKKVYSNKFLAFQEENYPELWNVYFNLHIHPVIQCYLLYHFSCSFNLSWRPAMNDRETWRKCVRDIRAGRTWWWWWFLG